LASGFERYINTFGTAVWVRPHKESNPRGSVSSQEQTLTRVSFRRLYDYLYSGK
jgi:hypothetical protein